MHSIPPTLQLNTKLSHINQALGVKTNGYSSFQNFSISNMTLKTLRPLCPKVDMYLSNIVHDTFTDLGVKHDKDNFQKWCECEKD